MKDAFGQEYYDQLIQITNWTDGTDLINLDVLSKIFGSDSISYCDDSPNSMRYILDVTHDIGISSTILHASSSSMTSLTIPALNVVNYLVLIPMSFLIPSSSGLATIAFPIIGPLAEFTGGTDAAAGAVTALSHASGLVNLITPTSGVVMGGLILAKMPYDKFLKVIAPLIITLFIMSLCILAIGGLSIGSGNYLIGM